MTKRRTRTELEAELRELRKTDRIWSFLSTMHTLIVAAGFVGVAYFADDAVKALAGRITAANIGISFLGSIGVSKAAAWLLGGGGVSYGYAQRRLRIKTAKRQGEQIRKLEERLDPGRSSSRYEGG